MKSTIRSGIMTNMKELVMATQTLQINEPRPCTQLDLDRLVRHDAVLKEIKRRTHQIVTPITVELHKLIMDAYAVDKREEIVNLIPRL